MQLRVLASGLAAAALLMAAVPALRAQDAATGATATVSVPSPILTLDQERFFSASAWGRRAVTDIEVQSTALAAENRRIEGELTAEERLLTDERKTLEPDAFRAKADAFDAKVVAIRADQDRKAAELATLRDAERSAFFKAALPVLGQILNERGAVAILDARAIFVAANAIDVTDQMIAAMDKVVGAGGGAAPADAPAAPGVGGTGP
jgi:Skp family chaperone for outer membrane proteins